ncbi:MAG: TolC family protein [Nitrospinae bacterium]|nr:TolC family protein [Nitrospinota bacterium]
MAFIKNSADEFRKTRAPVRSGFGLTLIALLLLSFPAAEAETEGKKAGLPPSLEETVRLSLEHALSSAVMGKKEAAPVRENVVVEAKTLYFEILYKKEQLDIAEEVKGYFEKAISKAEEKYESGDGDVSQSAITKMKLGLAGSTNDIIKLRSDIKIAKLTLGTLMGRELSLDSEVGEGKIAPLKFQYENYEDYEKSLPRKNQEKALKTGSPGNPKQNPSGGSPEKSALEADIRLAMRKAFIKAIEKRDIMRLAEKNRKITRALLVTEVANYDFGIGNAEDLFQSLIIYTRVSSGYYESIYDFNVAAIELERQKSRFLGL